MTIPLADRMELAKSLRRMLQARLPKEVEAKVVNSIYFTDDDAAEPDDLSEDALAPRLLVRGPDFSEITVDYLPTQIVITTPKRVGRGGGELRHVVQLEEGIGGRLVLGEPEEQIAERVVERLEDLRRRAHNSELRQVRKQIKELRRQEAHLVAAAAASKADAPSSTPQG